MRKRTLYCYRCFAGPLRRASQHHCQSLVCMIFIYYTSKAIYALYRVFVLCTQPQQPSNREQPSSLASGNMGAPCRRSRTSRSRTCGRVGTKNIQTGTCHMNISYTVVCGIYVQPLALHHNGFTKRTDVEQKNDLHENYLSASDFSYTVVCGSIRFFNISAAISSQTIVCGESVIATNSIVQNKCFDMYVAPVTVEQV